MRNSDFHHLAGKSGVVFEELEERFSRGVYKVGELLSPSALAAEFGVSLQPIRAALGQLRALGFVVVTPQVGCKVISPSSKDITDFFRLFGNMEGVMASLAAERHHQSHIRQLESISSRLQKCKIPKIGVPREYTELVGTWHSSLRDAAQSPILSARLSPFWKMSDFLLWQGAPNVKQERLHKANAQRMEILTAIKSKDPQTAERLMLEHVCGKPQRAGIIPLHD